MSFMLRRAPMAIKPRAKPPRPPETQVIPCTPGNIGAGITQTRVCTFDYGLPFSWSCTPWTTIHEDCSPAIIQFITPLADFDPSLGGSGVIPGQEQTYGPYTVNSGGYSMTLTYHVYVQGDENNPPIKRLSDLTIVTTPLGTVGTLEVFWDRDYASFPNKPVDPSGTTQWLEVPNSEWTDNASQFTINLYVGT
jgi:hypothetical protein